MKKLTVVMLCAIALVAFSSCKSKTKSASVAAKEYTDHLKNGNYDEFVEVIAFDNCVPAQEIPQHKAEASQVMKTKAHKAIQDKGGIKDTKIVKEEVASDGKNAEVIVEHIYNNGDVENVSYDLILDEENNWKVKMGHDREVWKTHLADGSKVAFKLKEDAHREILKEDIDGERDFVKEIDTDRRHVEKVKEDGEKEVVKVIEKKDETVIKTKEDGHREVTKVEKE